MTAITLAHVPRVNEYYSREIKNAGKNIVILIYTSSTVKEELEKGWLSCLNTLIQDLLATTELIVV